MNRLKGRAWLWAVLGLVVIAGGAFLAGRNTADSGGDHAAAAEQNAVAEASPASQSMSSGSDLPLSGGDPWCFNPIPGVLEDGKVTGDLGGFPARYLSGDFELAGISFGTACQQVASGSQLLETRWIHESTGRRFTLRQMEERVAPQPWRRYPGSLLFSDDGFQFNVSEFPQQSPGYPPPPVTGPDAVLDQILQQLAPNIREECFYARTQQDWPDLASYGVGDPRPQIPEGIVPIQFDFYTTSEPPTDCSTAKLPGGEPRFGFNAMFVDRHDNMLSIHFGPLPDQAARVATFQSGSAFWSSDELFFSMNWRPGLISEEDARNIARTLDPQFDQVCTVESRQLAPGELADFGLTVPVLPEGLRFGDTGAPQAFSVEPGEECTDQQEPGLHAQWLFESTDPPGIISVTVKRGLQGPNMSNPQYDESRAIYWKRADGAELWVEGFKAIYPRELLLEVAAAIDPEFDESQLTTPAASAGP